MAFTLYKDLNQFSPAKVGFVENAQAVYQSVYNILTTRKGERLFYPNFGIYLEDELFELNDDITHSRILGLVKVSLEEFEPRIQLDGTATEIDVDPDKGEVKITLTFSINGIDGQTFQIMETLQR